MNFLLMHTTGLQIVHLKIMIASNTCDTVSLFNSKALVNILMRLTGTCYLITSREMNICWKARFLEVMVECIPWSSYPMSKMKLTQAQLPSPSFRQSDGANCLKLTNGLRALQCIKNTELPEINQVTATLHLSKAYYILLSQVEVL